MRPNHVLEKLKVMFRKYGKAIHVNTKCKVA
jgi:hypothetical protein